MTATAPAAGLTDAEADALAVDDGKWDWLGLSEVQVVDAKIQKFEAELARRMEERCRPLWIAASRRKTIRGAPGEATLSWAHLHHPGYIAGRFHEAVCREYERFYLEMQLGRNPHMMVFAPPRHGKSYLTSKAGPSRILGLSPSAEVICASYGQDLADAHSRAARSIMRSPFAGQVFPGIRPQATKRGPQEQLDRASHWQTACGGSYKAVGVGGPVTGHGAWLGSIDDPVKSASEARSKTKRDAIWEWYAQDFYTRIAPTGGVMLTMTRWHTDDLAGQLLAKEGTVEEGGRWRVVRFPAIAEDDGVDWRRAGEALHPARWPLQRLEALRGTLGARAWAALFQQRPVPAEGGRYKREWFRERYRCTPESLADAADEVWITVDAAKKGKSDSDFHSIQVWALKGARKFLLDRRCERMGYPEFDRALTGMLMKWAGWLIRKGGAYLEDTANGTTYMQLHAGDPPAGVPLVPFTPTSSKIDRSSFMETDAEAGLIILPHPSIAPWVEDWGDTVCSFPDGANDDDVDAASQLVMKWKLEAASGGGSHWIDNLGL